MYFIRLPSNRSTRGRSETDWRVACREVLEMIWAHNDSEPFREPVDTLDHPGKYIKIYVQFDPTHSLPNPILILCRPPTDYLQIIDTPMDLMTIKEDLIGGNYASQSAFIKDMRLIFTNSKNYNINKRSRVSILKQSIQYCLSPSVLNYFFFRANKSFLEFFLDHKK